MDKKAKMKMTTTEILTVEGRIPFSSPPWTSKVSFWHLAVIRWLLIQFKIDNCLLHPTGRIPSSWGRRPFSTKMFFESRLKGPRRQVLLGPAAVLC
jgi:hypothetical protein